MSERNLDFDTVIDRRNTNCLKYDFAARRGMPEGLLPLWVADMDFRISSYIQDALIAQAQHGIYGYSELQQPYFDVLSAWCQNHYGISIEPRWLIKTPGIVFALANAVRTLTEPGDSVMIQTPVYYPFREAIENNGRRLVDNTLVLHEDGTYHVDFEDFEKKLREENVKLFLLCNPHNPVGRVWDMEELLTMRRLCRKHGVILVSDEIHADFIWEGTFHSALSMEDGLDNLIVCMSPSKTFNIAGLQVSNIFIPEPSLRRRFRKGIAASGYSLLNAAGLAAAEAAYRYGEEWYQAMKTYVADNIEFMSQYLGEHFPEVRTLRPQGTYLVWVDCRGLGLAVKELDDAVINKARLWLDSGRIFGKAGEGFQRFNAACPRATLEEALRRFVCLREN